MSILKSLRCIFADCAYFFASNKTKSLINKDVQVYASKSNLESDVTIGVLNKVLTGKETFRNVFYYRMKSESTSTRIFSKISRLFLFPVKSIEIRGGILEGGDIHST